MSLFVNDSEVITPVVYTLEEVDDTALWLHKVIYRIRMSFLPIIVLGTVTNAFNFTILMRRDMRFLSTSVYLFALAIADTGVMYFELLRVWFEWADLVPPESYFSVTYCKLANYTNGVTRDFSNWLIACLTLERLMMVASPFKAKYFCTVHTARKVTVSLFLTLCIPHIHCLIFSVPIKDSIGWTCWEDQSIRIGVILAAVVEFSCGYVVIVVVFALNITLIAMIYKNKLPCLTCSADRKRANANRRLTRTLVLVAIVFLVCETPRMIMSFISRFLERTPLRRIIINVSYVLSGINHACNFFIYILASPRFRQLLSQTFPFSLLPKRSKTKKRKNAVIHRLKYNEQSSPILAGVSGYLSPPTVRPDDLSTSTALPIPVTALKPPAAQDDENTTFLEKTPPVGGESHTGDDLPS